MWHKLNVPHTATRGPGRPPAAKAAETRERVAVEGATIEVTELVGNRVTRLTLHRDTV